MTFKSVALCIGRSVVFAIGLYEIISVLSYIVTGAGIWELYGGTSSPVVVAIADKISGTSPIVFWSICAIGVVIVAYIMYSVTVTTQEARK